MVDPSALSDEQKLELLEACIKNLKKKPDVINHDSLSEEN